MTFSQFIKAKGFETLAVVLSCPLGTIYSYSSKNLVPRHQWPDLLLAFPELGLTDLMRMEIAGKERV